MEYEDLRTPGYKAKMEKDAAKWRREAAKAEKARRKREASHLALWADKAPWQPINDDTFDGMEYETVLVCNQSAVAIAYLTGRFGRPMICVKEPKMAITDHGMAYVGGEYKEPDWPEWMFRWELKDQLSRDDERYGKDEIGFVPTHWMPLPPPANPLTPHRNPPAP